MRLVLFLLSLYIQTRALINDDFHPREQFRKLEYNDIEEFMNFRCELQDQRIQPLQKKINAYVNILVLSVLFILN